MARVRTAVLISGRGSNLQALLAACAAPDFPAEIVLVVSNEPDAGGLAYAEAAGVPTTVICHRDFDGRDAFERTIEAQLAETRVDLICLAGFMRLLTGGFVARWRDRLINIHPSLLPSFRGLHTHERAIAAGVRLTGCTVHFVRPTMDDGPIIVQAAVPVLPDDDADRLAARVLSAEHLCYPWALRLVADGRAQVVDERVVLTGVGIPEPHLISPPL